MSNNGTAPSQPKAGLTAKAPRIRNLGSQADLGFVPWLMTWSQSASSSGEWALYKNGVTSGFRKSLGTYSGDLDSDRVKPSSAEPLIRSSTEAQFRVRQYED